MRRKASCEELNTQLSSCLGGQVAALLRNLFPHTIVATEANGLPITFRGSQIAQIVPERRDEGERQIRGLKRLF